MTSQSLVKRKKNRRIESGLDWKGTDGLRKARVMLGLEIERIRAFAENLAITDDYKTSFYSDELRRWDKLSIDAEEISKDLMKLVETANDKYLELSRIIEDVSNELKQEHKED